MRKIFKERTVFQIVTYLFLTVLLLLVLYPFLYAFMCSFKDTPEILTSGKFLPSKINFKSYEKAWTIANFSKYTWNSVWYSALNVLIALYTSAICGYVFARGEFRGKNVIFALFTSLMFITLGTSSLYPQLEILKKLHLNNTLFGLVVMHFFAVKITNVFLVRGFVNSLPKELDEAAAIDGCSYIGTFFKIILPLLKPIMATVGIFAFTSSWNDYLMPMIVTLANPAQRTLPVGMIALKGSSEAAVAWNLVLAGGMISALPMIAVYLTFNRFFIKGLTSGAVKG